MISMVGALKYYTSNIEAKPRLQATTRHYSTDYQLTKLTKQNMIN